jgi:hypothetical protein
MMPARLLPWLIAVLFAVLALLFGVTPLVDARRQRLLRQCLLDMCDVLNVNGVDYWCDFGTLLGYYRDHDVIRTDYDVDLCLLAEERAKLIRLVPAFKACGYTLTDSNGTTKLVIRIANDRTGYYADVYVYLTEGPMARSTFRSVEDVPLALVSDRVEVPFLGGAIRVPRQVEPLLLHRYGPGFRVPRRGDQGLAYGYSRIRTLVRILENNCLGIWSVVRSPWAS